MTRLLVALLLFCFLLVAPPSHAKSEVEERLGFAMKPIVQGKAYPKVIITPKEDVKLFEAVLFRSDGKKVHLQAANVKAGTSKELLVRQPTGKFDYKAEFRVTWAKGGESVLRIKFALTRSGALAIKMAPSDVDLDGRKLTFELSNRATRAELRIYAAGDKELELRKRDFGGAEAGKKLEMTWADHGGEIHHLQLKVWDETGFWAQMRLEPISMSIPHREVAFAFGKSGIRKSEEPQLQETLEAIHEALDKYGKAIHMRLYVAGYSDTVGAKDGNRRLSAQRARSIGAWFRNKGIKVPIYYQGFGEDVLAVATPDETPEPANRRALYVLSTHTPAKSAQLPKSNWKKLW